MKLWNPTKKDLVINWSGDPAATLLSMDYTNIDEEHLYNHAKKHLIDHVMNTRGIKSTDKIARKKIALEVGDVS